MKHHYRIKNVLSTVALIVSFGTLGPVFGQTETGSQQTRAAEKTKSSVAARSGHDESISQYTAKDVSREVSKGTRTEKAVSSDAREIENNSLSERQAAEARRNYEWGVALTATNLDLASEKLKNATTLEPGNAQAHYSLGLVYTKLDRYKEAAESFKRAARIKPNWAEAHFRLGQVYYVLNKENLALDEYKRLLDLDRLRADALLSIIKNDGKVTPSAKPTSGAATNTHPSSLKIKGESKEETASSRFPLKNEGLIVENQTSRVTAPSQTPPVKTQDSLPGAAARPVATSEMRGSLTASLPATGVTSIPESNAPNAKLSPDPSALSTYRVGIGDVLDIRLLNSPTNRSTLYTVIDGGLIDYPLAGNPMPVAGLTTEEIHSRLGVELKRRGIQENAQLSVVVREYDSHEVTVTGLVGAPGTKKLRREAVPLYVILAEALPRAEAVRATITSDERQALTVDLTEPANLNVLIRPGDHIILAARPQEFYYIGGQVGYPGKKEYQPGITLLQAILAAGGFSSATGNAAEVSREGSDKRLSTTKYKLREIKAGKVPDPQLEPGDRVEVIK